jgi:mono/diheme cytochrome c family protein
MLPGTAALQIKHQGEVPPALEDRDDLSADVLRVFLRQGSFSMPPFRPTELSDQDIADIAAYLASSLSAPDPR